MGLTNSKQSPSVDLVAQAFLSHTTHQKDFVQYLGSLLKGNGVQYFSSAEVGQGCEEGQPFDSSLLAHVCSARVVVLVLSRDFFSRKWCITELAHALLAAEQLEKQQQQVQQQRKMLLPVFYGWEQPGQLLEWLGQSAQRHLHDSCLRWTNGMRLDDLVGKVSR